MTLSAFLWHQPESNQKIVRDRYDTIFERIRAGLYEVLHGRTTARCHDNLSKERTSDLLRIYQHILYLCRNATLRKDSNRDSYIYSELEKTDKLIFGFDSLSIDNIYFQKTLLQEILTTLHDPDGSSVYEDASNIFMGFFRSNIENRHFNRRSRPEIHSAIGLYTLGRTVTSPRLIDNYYSDISDRSSVIAECIELAARNLSDNRSFVDLNADKIYKGELSLCDFRDNYIRYAINKYSIDLEEEHLPDTPACLISIRGYSKIYHDINLNSFQKSFAILHEFCHFIGNDKSYLDFGDSPENDTLHRRQEYRCDYFSNIMLRSLEGLFVAHGGDTSMRDYAPGILSLFFGRRPLRRVPVMNASGNTNSGSHAEACEQAECDGAMRGVPLAPSEATDFSRSAQTSNGRTPRRTAFLRA